MSPSCIIIFTVIFIAVAEKNVLAAPEVTTSQGSLRGKISVAEDGTEFHSFLNIPFAKPPVGNLRFKDPQPPDNWDGILEAFNEPIHCAQFDGLFFDKEMGQEDCLYLSVHTPANASSSQLLPVMFWIHGGGYYAGYSSEMLYGPEYLIKKGVVFVAVNYRLGPMGFLNMNTPEVPGNAGVKDALMALKWVNKHINHFGGDPNRITIFGESSGSVTVNYLVASPSAKGLMQRAISQSGVSLNDWALNKKPEETIQRFARALNIHSSNSDEILAGLLKCTASEIVNAMITVLGSYPFEMLFVPSIEKEFPGVEAIITRDPLEIFRDGDYNQIPTILGFNNAEGELLLWRWEKHNLKENPKLEDIVTSFDQMIPADIANKLKETPGKIEEYTELSKKLYFDSGKHLFDQYIDFAGDMMFKDGTNRIAKLMTQHSPIFLYNFVYNGGRNLYKMYSKVYDYPGAAHFDDIGYIFHTAMYNEKTTSEKDFRIMKLFHKLWTDFAKGELDTSMWIPANKDKMNCLVIDENPTMVDAPFPHTVYFWEKLRKSLNLL